MEVRQGDRDTANAVAGVARLMRRAAALVRVRADRHGPRSPAAVLIIFVLLWAVTRDPGLYVSMHRERGY
jgi:hypothetical protein